MPPAQVLPGGCMPMMLAGSRPLAALLCRARTVPILEDQVDIHFNDTRPAGAPAGTLSDVITEYARYPDFNPVLIHATVVGKDVTPFIREAERRASAAKA
jgi:hypothetical protein